MALGNGQQPYSPDDNLQHVFPSGHSDWPSGHATATFLNEIALVFNEALMTSLPLVHEPKIVRTLPFKQNSTIHKNEIFKTLLGTTF